jgi:hypothetical protein
VQYLIKEFASVLVILLDDATEKNVSMIAIFCYLFIMLGRLWRLLGFSNTDQEPHQRQAQYHPLPSMALGYPPPFGLPSGMALTGAGNSNHEPVAPGPGFFHQGEPL